MNRVWPSGSGTAAGLRFCAAGFAAMVRVCARTLIVRFGVPRTVSRSRPDSRRAETRRTPLGIRRAHGTKPFGLNFVPYARLSAWIAIGVGMPSPRIICNAS